MVLKELIDWLEQQDQNAVVPVGFNNPHSYRGDYYSLAFEPATDVTFGAMLEYAKSALGETYTGYKGGEFEMHEYTDCYIAEWGCLGDQIGIILLNYMQRCAEAL